MQLTVGELLALYAITSTSRAPRAKALAARVLEAYEDARAAEDTTIDMDGGGR